MFVQTGESRARDAFPEAFEVAQRDDTDSQRPPPAMTSGELPACG
jgi:hypothetical protein